MRKLHDTNYGDGGSQVQDLSPGVAHGDRQTPTSASTAAVAAASSLSRQFSVLPSFMGSANPLVGGLGSSSYSPHQLPSSAFMAPFLMGPPGGLGGPGSSAFLHKIPSLLG